MKGRSENLNKVSPQAFGLMTLNCDDCINIDGGDVSEVTEAFLIGVGRTARFFYELYKSAKKESDLVNTDKKVSNEGGKVIRPHIFLLSAV